MNDPLLKIAREHPDATGKAGEVLRARIKQHATLDLIMSVNLSHARLRQSVVTGARMAIRCGGLLLSAPTDEFLSLLPIAGISPEVAEVYLRLAAVSPDLTRRCLRRRGQHVAESEAHTALRSTDLRALLQ